MKRIDKQRIQHHVHDRAQHQHAACEHRGSLRNNDVIYGNIENAEHKSRNNNCSILNHIGQRISARAQRGQNWPQAQQQPSRQHQSADHRADKKNAMLKFVIAREQLGEVVGTVSDEIQAVEEILFYQPDIVLIDLLFPHTDGIQIMVGASVYDAFQVIFAAINAVGTDPAAMRDYIAGLKDFDTVTGKLMYYTSAGSAVKPVQIQRVEDDLQFHSFSVINDINIIDGDKLQKVVY